MNDIRRSNAFSRREFMTAGGAVLVSNLRPPEVPHPLCFPRWGTNDGPGDAIEHLNDWPLLHALQASL